MNDERESTPLKWIAITTAAMDTKELAIAAMEARIESLEVQLSSKDRQIEAREREVGELHRLLAQTALNAAPARPWWRFWG